MDGQVVTFYSYKGGVGRSFLLANIAVLLARWGYKILCVDWDIEAPGLRHYFQPWMTGTKPGLIELVNGYGSSPSLTSWTRYVNRVVISAPAAKFDFIAAGLPGESYFDESQKINWRALYNESDFGKHLEQLRAIWKRTYDFVLVDSRTGVSDLAGVSTVHLPDILLFVFTANRQSIEGAASTVRRIVASRSKLPFDREKMPCVPILSRFATDKEYTMAGEWMRMIEKEMAPFYADWVSEKVSIQSLLQLTRLPEVAYWTFGERLALVEEPSADRDPQSVNYAMWTIAALLSRRLQGVQQMLLNRDSFVAQAEKEAKPNPDLQATIPVFISAPRNAQDTARELADALQLRNIVASSSPEGAASGDWREELLRQLRNARYLVVLVAGELGEWQNAEIEQFFSLTVRSQSDAGILPIILDDKGLRSLPPLLRSRESIDGRKLDADAMADKVAALIEVARTESVAHFRLV